MKTADYRFGYDVERSRDRCSSYLAVDMSVPLIERAYRAVAVILIESGMRGLTDVKTATIAELAGTTESTLFRHIKNREDLIAETVDWAWETLNLKIAMRVFEDQMVGACAEDVILRDLSCILDMFADDTGRLCGTIAFLAFRRSDRLLEDFRQNAQHSFRRRLTRLCQNLVEPQHGEADAELVSTFLTNSVATIWFTWLADSQARGPAGLLGRDFAIKALKNYLVSIPAR